ncbi:MAG: pYEATS domain-containing protein [Chlorobiaceae bacterium]
MDDGKASVGSWWSTLPGILTAIGSAIGSITTLIVTLHQFGFFSPKPNPPLKQQPPVVVSNNIIAGNSAVPDGKYWQWTMYIQAPDTILDKIHYVVYTLHPTYSDSIVTVYERGSGPYAFRLTRDAWGTFRVKIHIVMHDGTTRDLSHYLKF